MQKSVSLERNKFPTYSNIAAYEQHLHQRFHLAKILMRPAKHREMANRMKSMISTNSP